MNNQSSGCYVIDSDYNIVNMNDIAKNLYPQLTVGKKCYRCLMNLDAPCGPCPVANGVKGPSTYTDPIRHISEVVDAVDIDIEGKGPCHALIFSTVEEEATFAATLPTSAEDLKNLALVKALTVDYYDVFTVNLVNDNVTMYRHNGKPIASDSEFKQPKSYTEGLEEYISRYVLDEDRDMLREKCSPDYLRETLKEKESFVIQYRVLLQGEVHYFFRKIARIGEANSFENIVVGIGNEDDKMKRREERLLLKQNLRRVEYSVSTGLFTKEAFFIYGEQLLAKYPDTDFDFCILRIENLGSINHQYGRIAGDRSVQLIGEILKTYDNEMNCIAYFGDGMYGSLTVNTPDEERRSAIMGFRDTILERSEIKNLLLKWSIYKAISRDISLEDVYEKVAYAIATVRSKMPQEYIDFDKSMLDRLDWDRAVETNFKKALADGEFVAWYQPKYSVYSREIIGAEALVRWVRPNGEMVSPARFIPVLENCGMIKLLDEEIFRQTCLLQKTIAEKKLKQIPISVNLSRASIFTNDIAQSYSEIAAAHNVDTHLIPIEITESAAVRASMIREFADSLIEKGFSLHMDDFGSGYSSLASLQIIPFESIKLDKTLVDFIGKQSGENLLRHTISFARESGMSTVAEGVETLEQYLFLKAVGCNSIQGYYFSKPLTPEAFLEALAQ